MLTTTIVIVVVVTVIALSNLLALRSSVCFSLLTKIVKMAGEKRATGLTGGSNRLFVSNGFFYHLDSIAEDDINDVRYEEVLIICTGCNRGLVL